MAKKKKTKARKATVRSKPLSKMHVRSVLYKHYKTRYNNWQDTKADADQVISKLKQSGLKRPSKKAIIAIVAEKRKEEIKIRKIKTPRERIEYYFQGFEFLLEPFPFYSAQDFCDIWRDLWNTLLVASKYVWTTGMAYRGGEAIPYDETFRDYVNRLEKLQNEPRRSGASYESDWFFRLEIERAQWDEELKGYVIPVITCDVEGKKAFYFDEEEYEQEPIEPEREAPAEGEIPEPGPEPAPPAPPEKAAPPAGPVEFTPEQRMEIEKEKVRVEAEQKAKTEVKLKALESAERLLREKVISFDQYMEVVNKLT